MREHFIKGNATMIFDHPAVVLQIAAAMTHSRDARIQWVDGRGRGDEEGLGIS
jgi:hypothetical protein